MKKSGRRLSVGPLAATMLCICLAGCYSTRASNGGGQTVFAGERAVRATDIALPAGYRIVPVATGLTFPTGVAFDGSGVPHVVESGYSYGEVWTVPRLLRIAADGSTTEVARGERNGPWTGVAFAHGSFYVAEGGELEGGRILRIQQDGRMTAIVSGLPSTGDHHTDGPAIGADGKIYFGQGTATNSGVVGEDNLQFGWLKRHPQFHDVPCRDITLTGQNFESADVLKAGGGRATTGAYSPFGTPTSAGQVISGRVPCSGAILRVAPEGGPIELVAWGLRNPFGLAFAPDGELYVTENAFDNRGSRPVWGAGDVLWRITPGAWYGWPDHAEGQSVTKSDFKPPGKPQPLALLAARPGTPPRPTAILGVHASADGIDFSRSAAFGFAGRAFIAEFGDQSPTTGKVLHPVGFRVVTVDTSNGRVEDFAVNRGERNGPASKIGGGGLERPLGLRFSPDGRSLYVVDFGVLLMGAKGPEPQQRTGVLWRITREGGS
jgi:glucose/arabinose dehydrogenase